MGLMPEGNNPFSKLDKQTVIGVLKATGSHDPDVLHAQRTRLLAPAKHLKTLSLFLMAGGAIFTLTVVLAIVGIPLALFGVWLWRFSGKNIAVVETSFADYTGSASGSPATAG